ncbi:hypothetical protein BA6E_102141 [Bacteroidales bacterium 6E]|nr:hypothetical protein BA6E_102141 [Bacteroidales bacterium 6E]
MIGKFKKVLILSGIFLVTLFIILFAGLYIWIDFDLKKNIRIAVDKYGGSTEDALIAYLQDTTNSTNDRTHLAIWTLGQIRSEKAMPVLKELYLNDPEGKTCKGRHNQVLCQREIYKAMHATEANWLPLHARLKNE